MGLMGLCRSNIGGKNVPLKICVKSPSDDQKQARRVAAERVVVQFGNALPDRRLLCLFDDKDCQVFKDFAGAENRGFYIPINGGIPGGRNCPKYIADELLVNDGGWVPKRAFDHFIYLHGSVCKDLIGLSMTFAHELQHFIQTVCNPSATAACRLAFALKKETLNPPDWNDWFCFPHEREARIVAKQIALRIFGPDDVGEYIAKRIGQFKDGFELRDWEFIRGLGPAEAYDLVGATQYAYRFLGPFRDELVRILEENESDFPGFGVADLDRLLPVS